MKVQTIKAISRSCVQAPSPPQRRYRSRINERHSIRLSEIAYDTSKPSELLGGSSLPWYSRQRSLGIKQAKVL